MEYLPRLTDLVHPSRDAVLYDLITFSPIPDEPPVVEITEPAEDLQLPADAQFSVGLYFRRSRCSRCKDAHFSTPEIKRKKPFVEPVEQENSELCL